MANKVTIDVEARFIDNMSSEAQAAASSVQKSLDNLDKKKVDPKIDADTDDFAKDIKEAEERAKRFGKTKTEKVLKADDKASSVIKNVENKSKRISGKIWTAIVNVKDSQALSALKNIGARAKGIAGKTWTAIVKVKNLAMAPLNMIKNALFNLKTLAATIVVGVAAKQFVLDPINLADAYSSAHIGFSTLLGEERGQQMMDDLDAFAKATPFKSAEVIAQTQRMIAMGWNAEDIIADMTTIGDAAAATGKGEQGLQQIVTALAQIKSKGKLSTEELNQLAEAGVSAKRYIAEGLGYGSGDTGIAKMTKDLENGAISSGKALEALLGGMKEYQGMMDKTANETVEGLWSQIEDTFEINIFRRWGQGLQAGAKEGLGSILELLDSSEGALESLGDTIELLGRDISKWVAEKLEKTVNLIKEITSTTEFQNASLVGKLKLLWDGVIANPFAEWWSDTVVPWWDGVAVPWLAEKAGKLGEVIGRGLSNGLLALLGMDVNSGIIADGVSIGGSFARGFAEGFDGAAVADAFLDAFDRIWAAMPWWAKALLFGYGAVKIGSGISSIASLIGTLGSASGGTGLLGFGAKMGVKMGAGGYIGKHVAGTGAGLGTSLIGLGSTAGFIYGGTTAISGGIDLYNGYKNDDDTAKKSGWWKVGGAGGGAALGAAMGSFIPGIGTVAGAGLGLLFGGLFGNWGANKVQEEAAEKARKLANAEAEAAAEAAELEAKMKELAKADMAKHFGDIALSADEVTTAVNSMIGQEAIERAYAASEAISQMDAAMQSFSSADYSLKKELWLTSLKRQAKLTDDEISGLESSTKTFSDAAKTYLEDAQYASSESITALMGNSKEAEKILQASTDYYDGQRKELESITDQLNSELANALSDNVISIDEKASIDNLRSQITAVMKQIQDDEYQASLNAMKAKYGTSDIDPSSYKEMMGQMHSTSSDMTDGLWEQFGHGSIGLEEGSAEWKALMESTLKEVAGVWETAGNLGMDKLQTKWADELGILGEDVASIFKNNTSVEIMNAARGLTDDTRASIGEMLEIMKPTTKEIQEVANAYEDMGMEIPKALQSYLDTVEFYEALAAGPDKIEQYLKSRDLSLGKIDVDAIMGSVDYTLFDEKTGNPIDPDKWIDDWDFAEVLTYEANANVGVNWNYEPFDDEWISPSGHYSFSTEALVEAGWTYNPFDKAWISPDGQYSFSTNVNVGAAFSTTKFNGTMTTFGIKSSYEFNTRVKLHSQLVQDGFVNEGDQFRGGIVGGTSSYPGFAAGGMVRGGARIITVAEEGTPEMIIPLGSQRRDRALKLWQKTGEMLDVPGFARGGLTRGNQDQGIRFHNYDVGDSAGGQVVQVEVGGITIEINVNASDSENIAEAIKAQSEEIAEAVAGVLAEAFGGQFENTPVKGGVA